VDLPAGHQAFSAAYATHAARDIVRYTISLLAVAVCLGMTPSFAAHAAKPDLGPQVTSKRVLTPEEKVEKEARKACKIEIWDIIATKEP
jgi:hypothetical protein